MRTVSRSIRLMLAAVVGLAMCLSFSASPAAAATAAWDLADEEQRLCVPAERPHRYFVLGAVAGSWDAPLVSELQGLPEGAAVSSSTRSVPPGDNGDDYVYIIGFFVVLPGLEYGEHRATLHVTDGTVSQTRPIVFDAGDGWSC
ncbi:DUF5980 family protein [Glycomyces sp. A-F 0318]|uniref:DUF5980 family protein n=1 Tax=Glycomyces amatae TaxID=2881355 RepID=UPI001E3504C8|nr:DUF5980 family protein [Glycomyces amatae]MCD0446650.1 DUF5980 family protein [Glycomyces amatae]